MEKKQVTKSENNSKKISKTNMPKLEKLKLLILVVNLGKSTFFVDVLEQFNVNMQIVANGEGSAPSNLVNLWGYMHKEREVIFAFVPEDMSRPIIKELNTKFETVKGGSGIAFVVPVSSIIGVSVYQFLINNKSKRGNKHGE